MREVHSIPIWCVPSGLARFYEQLGDYHAALPLYRRSFEIADGFLGIVVAIGPESFKVVSVSNFPDAVPDLVAFQARAGDQFGRRALAFEAAMWRKSRILDEIRSWRLKLRQPAAEDVEPLVIKRQAIVSADLADDCPRLPRAQTAGARCVRLEGTTLEGRYERLLG